MSSTTTTPSPPTPTFSTRLIHELSKLDPSTPLHYTPAHIHHTWALTFHSHPELYFQPRSLAEIQKIVTLARRLRHRLVTVGSGHSPSDLTCTSAWMLNLDHFADVVSVDRARKRITVQAGMRLRNMNKCAQNYGLTMPSLGSIHDQSIAGAIATATHGSSMRHGLLSDNVTSLRIVLANGQAVRCSASQNEDLFRAALVSLGALGVIVEVEYQFVDATNIEWTQTIVPISDIFESWNKDLWTQNEFVRVWWLPYTKRAIIWRAEKTSKPEKRAATNFMSGTIGYHTYHTLLWIGQYFPRFLPTVEWFFFGMQFGFRNYSSKTGIEPQQTGLLMDCLYSQFVNEWSIPLSKGPEALSRLTAWLNNDTDTADLPFSPKGVYVHSPIEVRVANTVNRHPRPFLDTSISDEPSLYLNATLYRPYGQDPPCRERYYQAFEYLMRSMNGRAHWAKNFTSDVNNAYLTSVYGTDLEAYLRVRNEVDPEGMFLGAWHRRTILPVKSEFPVLALEEKEVVRRQRRTGGLDWIGEQARWWDGGVDVFDKGSRGGGARSESEESFDLMYGAEAEASLLLESLRESKVLDGHGEELPTEDLEPRIRNENDGELFGKM